MAYTGARSMRPTRCLYSYGIHSYGLYSNGRYSCGIYSYGLHRCAIDAPYSLPPPVARHVRVVSGLVQVATTNMSVTNMPPRASCQRPRAGRHARRRVRIPLRRADDVHTHRRASTQKDRLDGSVLTVRGTRPEGVHVHMSVHLFTRP